MCCDCEKVGVLKMADKEDSLVADIRNRFTDRRGGHTHRLSVSDSFPAWTLRIDDWFGVAVAYDGQTINEEFYSVSLSTISLSIDTIPSRNYLILKSTNEKARLEFAVVCADFVDPGDSGNKRRKLLDDPLSWFSTWKELLGNSLHEKAPYSVLGELLTYYYFLKNKINIQWTGPNAASHDFSSDSLDAEVKSTIKRVGYKIHVSNEFQLDSIPNKNLALFFYRFEINRGGLSIDKVVKGLISLGVDHVSLKKSLCKLGFKEGSHYRKEEYKVHEALKYAVDGSFPRIGPYSFKNDVIPENVENISYDLDIESFPREDVSSSFDSFYS